MSPLKIHLLLNMHHSPAPLSDMPHRQAFSPAMHKALADFQAEGLVRPSVTLTELRLRTVRPLTLKGGALVARLMAVEPAQDEQVVSTSTWRLLTDALRGALVEDVLPYHSPEWIAKARAALRKAGAL